jgi:hypothetical protein
LSTASPKAQPRLPTPSSGANSDRVRCKSATPSRFGRVALLGALAVIAGCATSNDSATLTSASRLVGQPNKVAVAAFGMPDQMIRLKDRTISSWLKTDEEVYAGLSNRRELKNADGREYVSETTGIKMKKHHRQCEIRITADAKAIITKSEIIGDAGACRAAIDTLQPA